MTHERKSVEYLLEQSKSAWVPFKQSDFDNLELNARMKEYAEAAIKYAASRGISLTAHEQFDLYSGKFQRISLTGPNIEFAFCYIEDQPKMPEGRL